MMLGKYNRAGKRVREVSIIGVVRRVKPGINSEVLYIAAIFALVGAFPYFSINPKVLRPDWWLGLLFILLGWIRILRERRIKICQIDITVLGLHGAVLLSVLANFRGWGQPQWMEFLTLWLQLIFSTLLYFSLANTSLSSKQLRALLQFWIGVAAGVAFYALYQAMARNLGWPLAYLPYLHPSPDRLPTGLAFGGYVRPSSVFHEPTYLGMYMIAPLLIVSVLVLLGKDNEFLFSSRFINYATLIILLVGLIASFSLSAYLSLIIVVIASIFSDKYSRKIAVRIILISVLIMVFVVAFFYLVNVSMLTGIEERFWRILKTVGLQDGNMRMDPSTNARIQELVLGITTWVHHPLWGVGLNQLQFVGKMHAPKTLLPRLVERGYVHNMWLEVLVQLGVVGFVFFGLIWVQGLRMMRAMAFQGPEPLRWLGLAFFHVLLATMIRGFMGGPFTFTLYWFYLGMASLVHNLAQRPPHTWAKTPTG